MLIIFNIVSPTYYKIFFCNITNIIKNNILIVLGYVFSNRNKHKHVCFILNIQLFVYFYLFTWIFSSVHKQ